MVIAVFLAVFSVVVGVGVAGFVRFWNARKDAAEKSKERNRRKSTYLPSQSEVRNVISDPLDISCPTTPLLKNPLGPLQTPRLKDTENDTILNTALFSAKMSETIPIYDKDDEHNSSIDSQSPCKQERVSANNANKAPQVIIQIPPVTRGSPQNRLGGPEHEILKFVSEPLLKDDYSTKKSCIKLLRSNKAGLQVPELESIISSCDQSVDQLLGSPDAMALTTSCNLNRDDIFALSFFSYDGREETPETSKPYNILNDAIRSFRDDFLVPWNGFLYHFYSALRKLPYHNGVVYAASRNARSVNAEYTLGREVAWLGFTSTTRNAAMARRFAGTEGVVFRITLSHGKSISEFRTSGTDEVLIPPNAVLVVTHEFHRDPVDWELYVDIEEKEGTFLW